MPGWKGCAVSGGIVFLVAAHPLSFAVGEVVANATRCVVEHVYMERGGCEGEEKESEETETETISRTKRNCVR